MDNLSMVRFEYRKTEPIASVFHSHPNYEIFYFHEGKGNYLIGGNIYSLSPGDLILMHGMTLHCPNMDASYQYVRSVIGFDPAYIRTIAGQLLSVNLLDPFEQLQNCRIALQGDSKAKFEMLLADMNVLHGRTDAVSADRFTLSLVGLLLEIYDIGQNPRGRGQDVSTEKEQTVQKVISYLEDHYVDDVHLDDLGEHLHLNKHYLARTFRDITGVTIFTYLYRRRVNQAKIKFLLENGLSVTDVCFQVGFKNLSHFSRVFKQQVGQTPEQFRRMVKSQPEQNALLE
ncbi:AraC family transcriptional regulator [Paenibacillus sp. MBLB4367]|uniref:AraC family transcriptional regulator n=1 Tax=Paenibacillus sp. MBLB4367 TaxID=3384767 RepID=UPI003907EDE1